MKKPLPVKNTFWQKTKQYMYEHYGLETGKLIVHAGLITWTTSAVSQLVAIAFNKEIPSDQKKFLIPQEIADGALNIASFYLITNSFNRVASKLVSSGKWTTKAIKKYVMEHEKKFRITDLFIKGGLKKSHQIKMGDMSTNLGGIFKEDKGFHEVYDTFNGGVSMMSAVTGAVISSNLVTPFIRNVWGAKRQKEAIAREKMAINYKSTAYPTNGLLKI